jgi:hypothetical protein
MLRHPFEIGGYRTVSSIRTMYLILQNLNPRWVCKFLLPKLPSYVTTCNTICKSEISRLYMTHFPIPNIAKTTKKINFDSKFYSENSEDLGNAFKEKICTTS